jgi:DNA replicative helicase MCM subunit Mcm2 (Cdc46/Mcm family)
MELVVNEWLPEYLRPNASDVEKRLAEQFLNSFMQRSDRLFVKDPSPFLDKIHRFQKDFDYDIKSREAFKTFIKLILRNPERCTLVMEDELKELPKSTSEKLNQAGTNFHSDTYLFESANLTANNIVITTDVKLKNQMADDEHFQVVLLEDFLKDYQ